MRTMAAVPCEALTIAIALVEALVEDPVDFSIDSWRLL